MITPEDHRYLRALIKKEAAMMLEQLLQQTRDVAMGYAEKDREMGKSKPYNEPDYRTMELMERQARQIVDDSWYDTHEYEMRAGL